MLASLDGDAAAHRSLLSKLSSHLRGYFGRQLARNGRCPVDAEDLVQDVLVAIHACRGAYDRSQRFTPWLNAIARYKLLDYLRRTKGSIKDVPLEARTELIARDDFASIASAFDLQRAMAGLSMKSRRSIQYVKLDGLSVSEAAQRLGMSVSAVKVSVHRGMKALSLRFANGSGS
jgi:RNA polymerase sigma-70 factor (ECF subfamily)